MKVRVVVFFFVALDVLVAGALWFHSRPVATAMGWEYAEGSSYRVVAFDVVSELARSHSTHICVAPMDGDADWRNAFLVVDEPRFVDYSIALHRGSWIEISIDPSAQPLVRREASTVKAGEGRQKLTVTYTNAWITSHRARPPSGSVTRD